MGVVQLWLHCALSGDDKKLTKDEVPVKLQEIDTGEKKKL